MTKRILAALLCLTLLFAAGCTLRPVDPVPGTGTTDATEPLPGTTAPDTLPPETTPPVTSETDPPAPPPPETKSVTFVAAGDNIIYKGNWIDAARGQAKGEYDFAKMYARVASVIAGADIAYINQETLMCGDGFDLDSYPQFNSPQKAGLDLLAVGFDVIGMANNHMADKGAKGLAQTIAFWKSVTGDGTLMVGGYEDEADYAGIRTLERGGITFAFLAYTSGTNLSLNAEAPVIPVLDKTVCRAQIAAAREIADVVVVCAHWGKENKMQPNDYETEWAQYLADAGADIIIGSHPHVIQPIEYLTASDGREVLCAYSLGNFLSEQARDYNCLGGLLSMTISVTGDEVRTENVTFIPTVCHFGNTWYNEIYFLSDYTDELGAKHAVATYYDNGAITIKKLTSYLRETIDATFLPEAFR
ncbi:MAG: CapA family protein [Clostridia bacterium]|nr:CapA family protein [Clostridia bacterium]